MKYTRLISLTIILLALLVALAGALEAQIGTTRKPDQTPGPSVYIPIIKASPERPDNQILITLVDQTPVQRLPVTLVVRESGTIVWTATRTYETSDTTIFSLFVKTGVPYRINWYTRQGDYCTFYVATFEKTDHLSIFSGQCTL